ncbi:hypothetical protein [Streptomyces sp. NBC_01276]|uniref:hypothetical protein n=1 Tax=Streptomyces sp. NBC_01276 TaxID=2903808 RepID=UPI00352E7371
MDERWVGRRVYGDESDGQGQGPEEGRAYVELLGGPPQEIVDGAVLMSDHGRFGPGGRSDYEPAGGGSGDVGRFVWRGDVP